MPPELLWQAYTSKLVGILLKSGNTFQCWLKRNNNKEDLHAFLYKSPN
jgi:hypothetical protein